MMDIAGRAVLPSVVRRGISGTNWHDIVVGTEQTQQPVIACVVSGLPIG